MDTQSWAPAFHLAPRSGWINDPNGLCYFRGAYHVFFQFAPNWPEDDLKWWGHFSSPDLIRWTEHEPALAPDVSDDRSGVYSGCAYIDPNAASDGSELMRLYYTGNVVYGKGHDGVHTGREANEIMVTSEDGFTFSDKKTLLRNADYPKSCSLHVRDPKVWEQDGNLHMVLGARSLSDVGEVLVYDSDDAEQWSLRSVVVPQHRLGFMWECPNFFALSDAHGRRKEFLAICPQGLESQELRWHNLWQAGYIELEGRLLDTQLIDETGFVEWDHGFDFYAPQVMDVPDGRCLLIGWMGGFDKRYNATPAGLGWCHSLTVVRELSLDDEGRLIQWPAHELEQLRGACYPLPDYSDGLSADAGIKADVGDSAYRRADGFCSCSLPSLHADIELSGIRGPGNLVLNDSLRLRYSCGADTCSLITIDFIDEAGEGREKRSFEIEHLHDLRVLVDGSCVEFFFNRGRNTFATRWFSRSVTLRVAHSFICDEACVWQMELPA